MGKRRGSGWLLAGAVAAGGCGGQDAEHLARVGRKVAARVEHLAGPARDRLADHLWDGAGLDTRVSARLRWEQALAGTRIQVRVVGPGAVELAGTVADEGQRQRAGELAEATAGVGQVANALEVEP
jgi:hypothetical protein